MYTWAYLNNFCKRPNIPPALDMDSAIHAKNLLQRQHLVSLELEYVLVR